MKLKKLHDLGFALHWLRHKSKVPVESGWSKGPRHNWDHLKKTYKEGFNVGTRLGTASKLKCGNFLAVLDCDVKSLNDKHVLEMESALNGILKRASVKPGVGVTVISGRGNGSKHVYIKTKIPATPKLLERSNDRVKVYMPSVQPSRSDRRGLTVDELKSGLRLRPAWEISLMGEGQQVVLPPSKHPDSGRAYKFGVGANRNGRDKGGFPLFAISEASAKKDAPSHQVSNFKSVDVDLVSSNLSGAMVNRIISGDGCEDRSASLFSAALAMVGADFSDNEILSVLTDENYYLGKAGFEHAKTRNRAKAAKWIAKYTLGRAREKASGAADFDSIVGIEEKKLTEDEAKKQNEALSKETPWTMLLERTQNEASKPLNSLKNLRLILENAIGKRVFLRNLFSGVDIYGEKPPWNGAGIGDEIRDIDIINMMHWLANHYRLETNDRKLFQVVSEIASKNAFHPVRDYLKTLEWDGVARLDNWLRTYMGAKGTDGYLQAIGRKSLVAMVARVMVPGIKFDQVLILEGPQGVGKSTAVRILASPWFSDAHINIDDKDSVLLMRSAWAVELGELGGMRKADVNTLKEFISRQADRIRVPYGRMAENFPRQCIFIGTTNSDSYLKDTTGNRRFWPVKVGAIDIESLKRDRDQLLAEAQFCFQIGENLWLDDKDIEKDAQKIQAERVHQDTWEIIIGVWAQTKIKELKKNGEIGVKFVTNMQEIFSDFGPLSGQNTTIPSQMRAADCMKKVGFKRFRSTQKGVRIVKWELDFSNIF